MSTDLKMSNKLPEPRRTGGRGGDRCVCGGEESTGRRQEGQRPACELVLSIVKRHSDKEKYWEQRMAFEQRLKTDVRQACFLISSLSWFICLVPFTFAEHM